MIHGNPLVLESNTFDGLRWTVCSSMVLYGCLLPFIEWHGPLQNLFNLRSSSGHRKGMDPQHRLWTQLGLPCISVDACHWIPVDLCGNQGKCVMVTFEFHAHGTAAGFRWIPCEQTFMDPNGLPCAGNLPYIECLALQCSPWYSNTIHQSMPFLFMHQKANVCMQGSNSRPPGSSSCSFLYTFGRIFPSCTTMISNEVHGYICILVGMPRSYKSAVWLMHMEGHDCWWKWLQSTEVNLKLSDSMMSHLSQCVNYPPSRSKIIYWHPTHPCQSIGVHLCPLDGLAWIVIDPDWLPWPVVDWSRQCWWCMEAALLD